MTKIRVEINQTEPNKKVRADSWKRYAKMTNL